MLFAKQSTSRLEDKNGWGSSANKGCLQRISRFVIRGFRSRGVAFSVVLPWLPTRKSRNEVLIRVTFFSDGGKVEVRRRQRKAKRLTSSREWAASSRGVVYSIVGRDCNFRFPPACHCIRTEMKSDSARVARTSPKKWSFRFCCPCFSPT